MEGRKLGLFSQAFSNRNRWVLGRAVGMLTRRGMWSEVVPTLEERLVLGKPEEKTVFTKALSKRARVGKSRLLLQV
jgi:hypothetical protein